MLIEHLEHHLGPIAHGWKTEVDGVQVAAFEALPGFDGAHALCTIGLSHHEMACRASNKRIRHEFLMLFDGAHHLGSFASILGQVSAHQLASHEALLRGDVLGPRGSLIEGSDKQALYVAVPVYLPDSFASVDGIAIAWIIPITGPEARFIRAQGWDRFEDRLIELAPDLTDLGRSSVVNDGLA